MGKKIVPVNLLEDIIDSKLDELMPLSDICSCQICRADVWALALNKLTPKYTVNIIGNAHTRYSMMNEQAKTDITTEIMKAIIIVAKSPHHDDKLRD